MCGVWWKRRLWCFAATAVAAVVEEEEEDEDDDDDEEEAEAGKSSACERCLLFLAARLDISRTLCSDSSSCRS